MKKSYMPVVLFALINAVFLSGVLYFYWIPSFRAIRLGFESVSLQERMLQTKESNLAMFESNQTTRDALEKDLKDGAVVIVPYSQTSNILAGVAAKASNLGLTRETFYMAEPSLYETGTARVLIVNVSGRYRGAFNNLRSLAGFIADDVPGVLTSASIYEGEEDAVMDLAFTLYAWEENE